jgi:hypothetical protein
MTTAADAANGGVMRPRGKRRSSIDPPSAWEGESTAIEAHLVSQKQFAEFTFRMQRMFSTLIYLMVASTAVSIAHLVVGLVR